MLALRDAIERDGYELVSFHAAGPGGVAYESWIEKRMFAGAIDLTPHELTTELFGGVATTRRSRLTTAVRMGLPQVIAPGGLDFVSRGPIETLSADDRARPHVRHSPRFTHVRLDAAQMRTVARELATRLVTGDRTITGDRAVVAIPMRGFSAEGRDGGALYDPVADRAFVDELRVAAPALRIVEIDAHINDATFAQRAWELLRELMA
jgi:uncharacterized protein (UPF0261 family)